MLQGEVRLLEQERVRLTREVKLKTELEVCVCACVWNALAQGVLSV